MATTTAKPALAAGDLHYFEQKIEGSRVADFQYGLPYARQVVLRFTIWADVAGTYSISLFNPNNSRSYVDTFTVTPAQAGNAYTDYIFAIPGDTVALTTVNNIYAFSLYICFAAGTTYQTATKGWQTGQKMAHNSATNGVAGANASFYLYDVGLYRDPLNTGVPPRWQMPDEAEELRACQRYYEKVDFIFSGNVTSSGVYYSFAYYKERKRTIPSLTGVNYLNTGFPTAVTTLTGGNDYAQESRTANATTNGNFGSTVTASARM